VPDDPNQRPPPTAPPPVVPGVVRPFVPPFELPGYAFEAKLGAGGMGDVYRAVMTSIGRTVAIKVLSDERCPPDLRDELRRRFTREARVLGQLQHPNVVGALDLGVSPDGQPYMMMDFVPGVDLGSQDDGTTRLSLDPFWVAIPAESCGRPTGTATPAFVATGGSTAGTRRGSASSCC
jgi:hypothetical protein